MHRNLHRMDSKLSRRSDRPSQRADKDCQCQHPPVLLLGDCTVQTIHPGQFSSTEERRLRAALRLQVVLLRFWTRILMRADAAQRAEEDLQRQRAAADAAAQWSIETGEAERELRTVRVAAEEWDRLERDHQVAPPPARRN